MFLHWPILSVEVGGGRSKYLARQTVATQDCADCNISLMQQKGLRPYQNAARHTNGQHVKDYLGLSRQKLVSRQ